LVGDVSLLQVAAFEEVLRGGDVVLASHTGSGKTLAYLLPLVSRHECPHTMALAHSPATGSAVSCRLGALNNI
jgi:superfamily II DNA/RNA helicase